MFTTSTGAPLRNRNARRSWFDNAAAAIGDDRLQQQSRGYVVPDAFTHGSSAQRQRWFTIGLKDGKVSSCNTFSATAL